MNILITFGGTVEAIDNVRHISNFSTGNTGRKLAENCAKMGGKVTAICAKNLGNFAAEMPLIDVKNFTDFDSLFTLVKNELESKRYDVFIHAAAVSDYKVNKIFANGEAIEPAVGKIPSGKEVQITLTPTPKIINMVKKWDGDVFLVGFKLTDTPDLAKREAMAQKVVDESAADMVILNDISEVNGEKHAFATLPNGERGETLDDLFETIWRKIK